jgi:anti-sigma factor RsiW
MEHRPYEEWLLDDERLTPEQQRDLRRHTAACPQCATLVRANLSLRSAPVARPTAGFALRFQRKLEVERKIQKRRAYIGLSLLTLVSIGILLWLITPVLPYLSLSPAQLFVTWVSTVIYLSTTMQALGTISSVLSRIVLDLVPPAAWAILLMALGGFGGLWIASLRKTTKKKAYSRVRL